MDQIVALSSPNNIVGAIDAELAEHAAAIRAERALAAGSIIKIGEHLIKAKARAGHGNWIPWLRGEFGWSERTARNYMAVAERSKSAIIADLNLGSALLQLTAPSTPAEVVAEVVKAAAESDHKVTVSTITRAKAANKAKRAQVSPAPAKSRSKADSPNIDPHDAVANTIRAKCGDGKWRLMGKIAATTQRAESACLEAMKRLEKDGHVNRRTTDKGIEYQIGGKCETELRRALAAQVEENARLKVRVAELEKLLEQVTAPTVTMASGVTPELAQAAE